MNGRKKDFRGLDILPSYFKNKPKDCMKKEKRKSLCSGYGVFPDGAACSGCTDCGGKFVKKPATKKQIKQQFDRNHAVVPVEKVPKFLRNLLGR